MLTTEISSVTYTGNGVTTVFSLPARVNQASHLVVKIYDTITLLTETLSSSEYSVSGFGLDAGVSVTYPLVGSPLSSTQKIILDRVVPMQQNLDIGTHSAWSAEAIEAQFDLLMMMIQQLQTNVDRNIYGPTSDAIADAAEAAAALFLAKIGGTMTGELVLKAGSTASASMKLQSGVAPTTPVTGQVWSTGTAIKAYLGATLTVVFLEEAHVWTAGSKQSFTHSGTTAGLRIVPAAGDPSGLSNGDLWYDSVSGRFEGRLEGVTYELGIPGVNAESLGKIAGDNPQAGNYTFALTDMGKMVRSTSGSGQTFTVPNDATVAFPNTTFITVAQFGAGQITFAAGAGVTIRSAGAKLKTLSQYSSATLYKVTTNDWLLFGDLTT